MAHVHVIEGSLGRVSFYNATGVAGEHRGWPLGAFVTDEKGVPLTEEFEVKFMHYKKGDRRDAWVGPSPGVTWHLVLSGAQQHLFAPDGVDKPHIKQVIHAGEAFFWDNAVPHKWVTEEDGMQVTVRRLRP